MYCSSVMLLGGGDWRGFLTCQSWGSPCSRDLVFSSREAGLLSQAVSWGWGGSVIPRPVCLLCASLRVTVTSVYIETVVLY